MNSQQHESRLLAEASRRGVRVYRDVTTGIWHLEGRGVSIVARDLAAVRLQDLKPEMWE